MSANSSNMLGFFFVFLMFLSAGAMIGKLLSKLFKWTGLSWLDRLLGGVFGLVRGALMAVVVVAIIMAFTPKPMPTWMVGSEVLPYVIDASNLVLEARAGGGERSVPRQHVRNAQIVGRRAAQEAKETGKTQAGGQLKELLIFDLDGTLIDSKRDLADSVNAMRVYLNEPSAGRRNGVFVRGQRRAGAGAASAAGPR